MRFFVSVFAAVAFLATATIAGKDDDRIVWHERPVKEQHGCVTTCSTAHAAPTEGYRIQCAICMDRIRNTVCRSCAEAYLNGLTDDEKEAICQRCRHISDWDSSSDFSDNSDSDIFTWGGPW